jgi:hypothetical protein
MVILSVETHGAPGLRVLVAFLETTLEGRKAWASDGR